MVRSFEPSAREVAEKLPEDLLSMFESVAAEEYGSLQNPVAALANEAMDLTLNDARVREIDDRVEWSQIQRAALIQVLVEHTPHTFQGLVDHCAPTSSTEDLDGEAESVIKQAEDIAEEIDDRLWSQFKIQAYNLYTESDEAVIQHIREAMTLVVMDSALSDLRDSVERESRVVRRLRSFIKKRTDFDLEENDTIWEVKTMYRREGEHSTQGRNADLSEFGGGITDGKDDE